MRVVAVVEEVVSGLVVVTVLAVELVLVWELVVVSVTPVVLVVDSESGIAHPRESRPCATVGPFSSCAHMQVCSRACGVSVHHTD